MNKKLIYIAIFFTVFFIHLAYNWKNRSGDNDLFVAALTPGISTKEKHSRYLEEGGLNANGKWGGFRVVAISDLTWKEDGVLKSVIYFLAPNPAPIPKTVKEKLTEVCKAEKWETIEQEGLLQFDTQNKEYKCSYTHLYNNGLYQVSITSQPEN